MRVHHIPVSGAEYALIGMRRHCRYDDFPADCAVERGDVIRFEAYDRTWPPFFARVAQVRVVEEEYGPRPELQLLAPDAALRQVIFVNSCGETFVIWVGDCPELKERSIAVLSNGQTLRVQTLCVRLRPEDVPPASIVLAVEEVESL
jgi:hypothetical protein